MPTGYILTDNQRLQIGDLKMRIKNINSLQIFKSTELTSKELLIRQNKLDSENLRSVQAASVVIESILSSEDLLE